MGEALLIIIFIAFSLLIGGTLFGEYETLSTLNSFVPVIILLLTFTGDENVELSFKKKECLALKHPVVSNSAFVITGYFSLGFSLWEFGSSLMANFFIWNK